MDAFYGPLYQNCIPKLLKDYQLMALSSLRGPEALGSKSTADPRQNVKMKRRETGISERTSQASQNGHNNELSKYHMILANQISLPTLPLLFLKDNSYSALSETVLNGEKVPCFEIGGEKRLCLIIIFQTVLKAFKEDELAAATNGLKLHVSSCTPKQLVILKRAGALPESVQNCGLITQTDAERLVNKLINLGVVEHRNSLPSANSFKVYHDCFGESSGLFDPELYTSEEALCIRCLECQRLFSPSTFVCHTHSSKDDRINHWGFNRKHWRHYLLLAPDQDDNLRVQKQTTVYLQQRCQDGRKMYFSRLLKRLIYL